MAPRVHRRLPSCLRSCLLSNSRRVADTECPDVSLAVRVGGYTAERLLASHQKCLARVQPFSADSEPPVWSLQIYHVPELSVGRPQIDLIPMRKHNLRVRQLNIQAPIACGDFIASCTALLQTI